MKKLEFGTFDTEKGYSVVDERQMRASAGIMLMLGLVAFVNGFGFQRYAIIPFISGFLMVNFLIGLFINSKYAPTMVVAKFITKKQSTLPIGAVQKQFAWSLGLLLATIIFVLSLLLQTNVIFFEPVCFFCIICIVILFFESSFGICVGCELYFTALKFKLLKAPKVKPNCMGNSCDV